MRKLVASTILVLFTLVARQAGAVEICGNSIDDDGNNTVDEGCNPTLVSIAAIADNLGHECYCKSFGSSQRGRWELLPGLRTRAECDAELGGQFGCYSTQIGECRHFNAEREAYDRICPGNCGPGFWTLCK